MDRDPEPSNQIVSGLVERQQWEWHWKMQSWGRLCRTMLKIWKMCRIMDIRKRLNSSLDGGHAQQTVAIIMTVVTELMLVYNSCLGSLLQHTSLGWEGSFTFGSKGKACSTWLLRKAAVISTPRRRVGPTPMLAPAWLGDVEMLQKAKNSMWISVMVISSLQWFQLHLPAGTSPHSLWSFQGYWVHESHVFFFPLFSKNRGGAGRGILSYSFPSLLCSSHSS